MLINTRKPRNQHVRSRSHAFFYKSCPRGKLARNFFSFPKITSATVVPIHKSCPYLLYVEAKETRVTAMCARGKTCAWNKVSRAGFQVEASRNWGTVFTVKRSEQLRKSSDLAKVNIYRGLESLWVGIRFLLFSLCFSLQNQPKYWRNDEGAHFKHFCLFRGKKLSMNFPQL